MNMFFLIMLILSITPTEQLYAPGGDRSGLDGFGDHDVDDPARPTPQDPTHRTYRDVPSDPTTGTTSHRTADPKAVRQDPTQPKPNPISVAGDGGDRTVVEDPTKAKSILSGVDGSIPGSSHSSTTQAQKTPLEAIEDQTTKLETQFEDIDTLSISTLIPQFHGTGLREHAGTHYANAGAYWEHLSLQDFLAKSKDIYETIAQLKNLQKTIPSLQTAARKEYNLATENRLNVLHDKITTLRKTLESVKTKMNPDYLSRTKAFQDPLNKLKEALNQLNDIKIPTMNGINLKTAFDTNKTFNDNLYTASDLLITIDDQKKVLESAFNTLFGNGDSDPEAKKEYEAILKKIDDIQKKSTTVKDYYSSINAINKNPNIKSLNDFNQSLKLPNFKFTAQHLTKLTTLFNDSFSEDDPTIAAYLRSEIEKTLRTIKENDTKLSKNQKHSLKLVLEDMQLVTGFLNSLNSGSFKSETERTTALDRLTAQLLAKSKKGYFGFAKQRQVSEIKLVAALTKYVNARNAAETEAKEAGLDAFVTSQLDAQDKAKQATKGTTEQSSAPAKAKLKGMTTDNTPLLNAYVKGE